MNNVTSNHRKKGMIEDESWMPFWFWDVEVKGDDDTSHPCTQKKKENIYIYIFI